MPQEVFWIEYGDLSKCDFHTQAGQNTIAVALIMALGLETGVPVEFIGL